uniref:Chemokine (C-X-C motif) receptor 5 n=1 Tax=Dicentrarchus labrax TaxID=13489 RepID=A0A8C4DD17_DICLA
YDTYCEPTVQQTSKFLMALHIFIFLLGVAGNGLMITIYLLHLAVADLMLLFTLPFVVVENASGWLFGNSLCKLTGLVKSLSLICGSFLLAFIGCDRYFAIVHPMTSMQCRRRRTVHITCTFLWLVCLALSVPNVVFLTVEEDWTTTLLTCSFHQYDIHANNWVLTLRVLDHVCFFLPLAIMSFCYIAVVVTLFKSHKSLAKQFVRLTLLITLVFCFCWLPYNITLLIKTLVDLQSLGLLHCCLNPFLYVFVGVRFRNELIQLLCNLVLALRGHSRPSFSDGATTTSTVLL